MKKTLRSIAASTIAALALVGCSSSASDSAKKIESEGKIRVGIEGTFVPYGYHDPSGKLVGFEVEIAKQIAKYMGVKPEFIETKWDSLIAGLDTNKYDIVINNINPTEERKQKYDFTKPYALSRPQILTKEDSDINSLADIKGKKCAQTPSSDYGQTAAKAGANVVPSQGFSESTQLIANGQADCTVNDVVTVAAFLKGSSQKGFRAVDVPDAEPVKIAIMLPKHQEELKEKLNASISKGQDNGAFSLIFIQQIGEDISPK